MSNTPRGRPRSESTRVAILTAARDLLIEIGWDALSIEQIAIRAGVSKQTVYRWWRTKGDVVAEGIVEGTISFFTITVADSADIASDLKSTLSAMSTALTAPGVDPLRRALIAAAAANEEVALRQHDLLVAPVREGLKQRLARAVVSGELKPGTDVDTMVDALVGAIFHRITNARATGGDVSEGLADLILYGAATGTGPTTHSS
ncbi:TetR/AcrR family transcriptional regulator [Leifsonia kafniensis]|uniref:TetR/AcrR family transcriptional regulator n=1 Tax=Leifsonia kafniensis TaxID=475957 RepID=A0ABP7KZ24_9MICO